ncbi:hypothetical protein MSNKSG1_16736 [Marinobacter santoriniensis NKSG1]|uniref:Uncharacterized protein n=1 Tax=Marinobacter santoriniensis NKSG1 TaxID=1288826 RepID=M7CM26_9GAMM|nr:hypothetical protein MSNKSG1_16736 [Marinobacter santoriniensis NKSG1]
MQYLNQGSGQDRCEGVKEWILKPARHEPGGRDDFIVLLELRAEFEGGVQVYIAVKPNEIEANTQQVHAGAGSKLGSFLNAVVVIIARQVVPNPSHRGTARWREEVLQAFEKGLKWNRRRLSGD